MQILTVNGQSLGGSVHQLKPGVTLEQAKTAAQKDGMDQVFFEAGGKNYVLQGDKLDFSPLKKGSHSFVQLHTKEGSVLAEIKGTDNEKTSFMEGGWNWGTKGTLIAAGAAVGLAVVGGAIGQGDNALGMVMSGMTLAPMLVAGSAVTFVGGGAITALKGSSPEKMQPLLQP
jgi:hypothetical protein